MGECDRYEKPPRGKAAVTRAYPRRGFFLRDTDKARRDHFVSASVRHPKFGTESRRARQERRLYVRVAVMPTRALGVPAPMLESAR
jgi:hypothetical protein